MKIMAAIENVRGALGELEAMVSGGGGEEVEAVEEMGDTEGAPPVEAPAGGLKKRKPAFMGDLGIG
jgi:hypothetical protein